MSVNPYQGLANHQFWRRTISGIEPFLFDPVTNSKFTIGASDLVATAGSCFAQHISSRLSRLGFNYFIAEPGNHLPVDQRKALNYGVFSARFGNIYTTRQLLQLFLECFCGRVPFESVWRLPDGRFIDALRPQVTPTGFESEESVHFDRAVHLSAVRRMFEECQVFVFTLGLTETWRSRTDGTVFPLAPGVAGGIFDPDAHEFINLDVLEVMTDLDEFLVRLKKVNPNVKVLLTVSPVPLIATFENRNVLVATSYSKSVLRVSAESAYRKYDWVDYFPSYEIIAGNFSNSAYYESDYRSVNALGVDHAMRCFLSNYTEGNSSVVALNPLHSLPSTDSTVVCDEEAIEQIRV